MHFLIKPIAFEPALVCGIFWNNAQMIHCYQKCQQNQFLGDHESFHTSIASQCSLAQQIFHSFVVLFKCSKDMFFDQSDLVVFAHVGRMWKRISMHNLKRPKCRFQLLAMGEKRQGI
jgi:hypothetical protein